MRGPCTAHEAHGTPLDADLNGPSEVQHAVEVGPRPGYFLLLAVALGKVESFVLGPKLAAPHVELPAFLILGSLILWESAFGVIGLFLSFPMRYAATRIAADLRGDLPGVQPAPAATIEAVAASPAGTA